MGYIKLVVGIFFSVCILQSLNADVKAPTLDDLDTLEPKKIVPKQNTVQKSPEEKSIVKKLKPKPKYYKLTINTVPTGAKVRITNIKPKYHAGMSLAVGTYNIKVSQAGYNTVRKKVRINNKSVSSTIKLSKKAVKKKVKKETINVSSNWGVDELDKIDDFLELELKKMKVKKETINISSNWVDDLLEVESNTANQDYKKGEQFYYQKKYQQAKIWYLKAARQDHELSQHSLGDMYYEGHGISKDYNQAYSWYIKAAEQGNELSHIRLAEMYEAGEGVSKNYNQAYDWYFKLAKQGGARNRVYFRSFLKRHPDYICRGLVLYRALSHEDNQYIINTELKSFQFQQKNC